MIFREFKEFKPYGTTTLNRIVEYMSIELKKILTELNIGLQRLSFGDNFESFEVDVTIGAGAELTIRNRLNGVIPSRRMIVRGGTGAESIVDGDTAWDLNNVYLKNTSASSVTCTVIFLK